MKEISKDLADSQRIARNFIEGLEPKSKATVVALNGDLGSSKTTFSQFVGLALGVEENMPSPTFLIERIYELEDKSWKYLIHIDAYRLDSSAELLHLGWKDLIENKENLILVEWAEKIKDILPSDTTTVSFRFINESEREIEIHEN
ncbi:MAG: tRNA threonylcarbamoyl adenosine modification protein YjeE [Parcubacteria bacterium C7867-005]|nr:MAG: tRNA threonylcarbamoyl adenosine modification protein YjeE [Parcubacteria bacterium C7867-005]